jgi:hypothetical protein
MVLTALCARETPVSSSSFWYARRISYRCFMPCITHGVILEKRFDFFLAERLAGVHTVCHRSLEGCLSIFDGMS